MMKKKFQWTSAVPQKKQHRKIRNQTLLTKCRRRTLSDLTWLH